MTTIGSSLSKADDGTGLINPAALQQVGGMRKYLTRAQFDAAVTAERARITSNGTGVWGQGEEIAIYGEVGVRQWFIGGSASASHARNVVLPGGRVITLAADSNVASPVSGTPTGGSNGDVKVNSTISTYYVNNSGTWSAGDAMQPLLGTALSGVTYETSGAFRVLTFTIGTVAYTVTYPDATHMVVAGGGKTVTVLLNSDGRIIGRTVA